LQIYKYDTIKIFKVVLYSWEINQNGMHILWITLHERSMDFAMDTYCLHI